MISDEAAAEIRVRYESGESSRSLADAYQVTQSTIGNVVRRAGGRMRLPAEQPHRHAISPRRAFTVEQDCEICAEYESGISAPDLARVYSVTESTILRAVHRAGGKTRRGGQSIRGRAQVWRRALTPEQDVEIARKHEEGRSPRELMREYGTKSECAIYNAIRRAGAVVRDGHRRWSDDEEREICSAYENNIPLHVVCAQYGISRSAIQRIVLRNGGRLKTPGEWQRSAPGTRRPNNQGYVVVKLSPTDEIGQKMSKKGWCLEHRLVMAHSLGRPLVEHERVHHRNGVRDDNRIENLELLTVHTHAPGQSVSDLHAEITRLRARVAELENA